MISFRQLIDFTFRGLHRLEKIEKLPLGSSLDEASLLYGEPMETGLEEDAPEIVRHTFNAGNYHEVVASEWDGKIQSITYWSKKGDPKRDLECMFKAYSGSSGWQEMEAGYWYQRSDGKIRLWCSAIPAIGVAFIDFLRVKSELKTSYELAKLSELEDVRWVSTKVVHELQRLHVEEKSDALMKFSELSDSIVVSPDGRTVFILRDHHAYDVDDGFMEINKPPDPETGYPSPVINVFDWSRDGAGWGKITLPRNAKVEKLRLEGDSCSIEILQTDGEQSFKLDGVTSEVKRLQYRTITCYPPTDECLWKVLGDFETDQARRR